MKAGLYGLWDKESYGKGIGGIWHRRRPLALWPAWPAVWVGMGRGGWPALFATQIRNSNFKTSEKDNPARKPLRHRIKITQPAFRLINKTTKFELKHFLDDIIKNCSNWQENTKRRVYN